MMGPVNYFEKGIGLHDEIVRQGHWLREVNGVWTASDPVAVQALIDGYIDTEGKLAALGVQYAQRIAAGRSYTVPGDASGAHVYQIDEVSPDPNRQSSIASISAVAQMADRALRFGMAGTPWDDGQPPFYFYDAANVGVPMTPQDAYDFAANVGAYVNALKQNYLHLKGQIAAATTQADLDATDVTAGWPANP